MKNSIALRVGQTINIDQLEKELFSFNYRKDSDVIRQGEFAHRGAVLDIFPFNFSQPVRLSLDFDEIQSIRGFVLGSGESVHTYTEVIILPVHEFFEKKGSRTKGHLEDDPLSHFLHIKKGDYVVHVNYGIGEYLGAKTLKVKGSSVKHLAIQYADNEILYVEADNERFIQRYVGMEGRAPRLSKLRTKDWERVKEKTRRAVKSIARDMLHLQAKRKELVGFSFAKDTAWQKEFESEFPYTETPDQITAMNDVRRDMESTKPMDRLICGDVGYGKTEVAMRAAFKAIMNNKQVAMLVPTTILAEQHYRTFKKRVANFPVRVECLSRFKTRAEQKEIVEELKAGACDIVIGTHRILSKDIGFKDLGLVIIDEEQRFGVLHKEKLKHYRALVDVLTLTATPIPRTLYMSFMGIRDISMITTPPKTRLPIETELYEYNNERIKIAFERELERKGQIYFVHNRVQSINKQAEKLQELLPNVRFEVAHGQMAPHELEDIMIRFFNGEVDCLVCTNIIESGLDVPNVNTIFVNRADMFGLSDLYQLRGRVGRFSTTRKAYAHFLIPKNFVMTQDAEKRLNAIQEYTALGSGFKIAMEDLELRGAGNILGSEQSGFISQVGFDLYCRLLHEAIQETKSEEIHSRSAEPSG
jgi:transcription-repair coupling factor (superfamily II helicase)